jgi:type I restriction enzyme, S subunit
VSKDAWATVPLCQIVDVLDSKRVPLSAEQRRHRLGKVPYYGATGQVGTIDAQLFDEPLILLGEDGVQFFDSNKPKAYKISGPAWVNNHAHVLRPKIGVVDFGYLLQYLNNFDYRGYANGTTRLKLTQGAMNSIPVMLPPLHEQRRIAFTLGDQLSRLDNALAELATARNRIDSFLRTSLDSEFSQLDAQKAAIKSLGSVKGGKRLPKGTRWNPQPTAHPYIRSTDIKNGYVNEANLVYVPESIWASISRYVVDDGDVLITIAGTIGQTAVVNRSLSGANLTENAAKISIPNDVMLPGFLEAYMRSPSVQSEIKGLARATTQPKLALYRIEEIEVPVPSLPLQASILERLRQRHNTVDALRSECQVATEKTSVLRRAVLHAAFSGKL